MLRSPIHARAVQELRRRSLEMSGALYDSGAGAELNGERWYECVSGEGPTVTYVLLEHKETKARLPLTMLTLLPWNDDEWEWDGDAMLFWDGGVAGAVAGTSDESLCPIEGCGPIFGGDDTIAVKVFKGGDVPTEKCDTLVRARAAPFTAFDPGCGVSADKDTVFTTLRLATYKLVPATAPPKKLPFMNCADGRDTIAKHFRGGECRVGVLVMSPAHSGKSSLCNGMSSVVSGMLESVFASNANAACGQFTVKQHTRNLFEEFGSVGPGGLAPFGGKELAVTDSKGYASTMELWAALSGRVCSGEALDTASPLASAEILARDYNEEQMHTVVVVPIRASAIVDATTPANQAYLAAVQEIFRACNEIVLNDGKGGRAFPVQVIPLITCVDEVAAFAGKDASCLGEESPEMDELRRHTMAAGVELRNALFIGWLQCEPAGGYDDVSDPRVKILWHLLCRCARFGSTAMSHVRAMGWLPPIA